jgi:hypothetical protein
MRTHIDLLLLLLLLRAFSVLHFGHQQRELEGVAVAVEFVTEPVDLRLGITEPY